VEGGGEVDCIAEDMVTGNKWIQHAMSVSRFVEDGGTLEKMVCSPSRTSNWRSFLKMGITICFREGCRYELIFLWFLWFLCFLCFLCFLRFL